MRASRNVIEFENLLSHDDDDDKAGRRRAVDRRRSPRELFVKNVLFIYVRDLIRNTNFSHSRVRGIFLKPKTQKINVIL